MTHHDSHPHNIREEIIVLYSLILAGRRAVCTMTCYRLDGPRLELWQPGDIFWTHPDQCQGPPQLLYNGSLVSQGYSSWGVAVTTHLLSAWVDLYLYFSSNSAWHLTGQLYLHSLILVLLDGRQEDKTF